MTLLICSTCPRYDRHRTGQFARALKSAITASGQQVPVRNVQCLGGCPDDAVIAVDGPGKIRVRFSGVNAAHADAIIEASLAHQVSPTGQPGEWPIPADLADKITSVTPKRTPLPLQPRFLRS